MQNSATKTALDGIWIVRPTAAEPDGSRLAWDAVYFELAPRCAVRVRRRIMPCTYSLQGSELELQFDPVEGQDSGEAVAVGAAPKVVRGAMTFTSADTWTYRGAADGVPLSLAFYRRRTPVLPALST